MAMRDNTKVEHWGFDVNKHFIPDQTEVGLNEMVFEFLNLR